MKANEKSGMHAQNNNNNKNTGKPKGNKFSHWVNLYWNCCIRLFFNILSIIVIKDGSFNSLKNIQ